MIYRWLILINNFCGFSSIKINKKLELKESKFFKIYGILRLIVIVLLISSLSFDNVKNTIYKPEIRMLKQSSFSNVIMEISVKYYHVSAFLFVLIHIFRNKKVLRFIDQIIKFELKTGSKRKLKIFSILSTFYYFGFLSISPDFLCYRLIPSVSSSQPHFLVW